MHLTNVSQNLQFTRDEGEIGEGGGRAVLGVYVCISFALQTSLQSSDVLGIRR